MLIRKPFLKTSGDEKGAVFDAEKARIEVLGARFYRRH